MRARRAHPVLIWEMPRVLAEYFRRAANSVEACVRSQELNWCGFESATALALFSDGLRGWQPLAAVQVRSVAFILL